MNAVACSFTSQITFTLPTLLHTCISSLFSAATSLPETPNPETLQPQTLTPRNVNPENSTCSLCFSTAVQDLLTENEEERCPPRQKSRVERLKAKVEPLLSQVTLEKCEQKDEEKKSKKKKESALAGLSSKKKKKEGGEKSAKAREAEVPHPCSPYPSPQPPTPADRPSPPPPFPSLTPPPLPFPV